MTGRLRPLLTAFCLLAGLSACEAPDPLAGHDWPEPAPALWEVTAPDGGQGWLFGTIHSLPDGVEWRTETIEQTLSEADLLVVEVAELADASASAEAFAEISRSPGLPPLAERFATDRKETVEALME